MLKPNDQSTSSPNQRNQIERPHHRTSKAISARNAETHGLTSSRIVLPYESQEEYDKLEASFIARFKPADEVEHELVHEMTASRWRLRRIELMETATFRKALREQQELQGPDADPAEVQAAAYNQVAESKTFRTLSRHQAQLRRSYEKAWKELDRLQTAESEEIQNEPTAREQAQVALVFGLEQGARRGFPGDSATTS